MFNFNIGTPQQQALWTEAFRQFAPGVSSNPVSNNPLYNGPTTVHLENTSFTGTELDEFIFTSSNVATDSRWNIHDGGGGNDLMIDVTENFNTMTEYKGITGGMGDDHIVGYAKNFSHSADYPLSYSLSGDEGNDTIEFVGGGNMPGSPSQGLGIQVMGGADNDNITIRSGIPRSVADASSPSKPFEIPSQVINADGGLGEDVINLESHNKTFSVATGWEGNDIFNVKFDQADQDATTIIYGGAGQNTVNLEGTGWIRNDSLGQSNGATTAFGRNPIHDANGEVIGYEQTVFIGNGIQTVNVSGAAMDISGLQQGEPHYDEWGYIPFPFFDETPSSTNNQPPPPAANAAPREANPKAA